MSKARYLSVFVGGSILANLLMATALLGIYVRRQGGFARFVHSSGYSYPILPNNTIDSLVTQILV